jgi:hypothetical protein
MIGFSLAAALLAGFLVTRAIAPALPAAITAGASVLVGLGLPAAVLGALAAAGVPWSGATALGGLAIIGMAAVLGARRRRLGAVTLPRLTAGRTPLSIAFDALTAVVLSGYALFALSGHPPETDYVTIWGLKGLRFFHARGIDFEFLSQRWNAFSHPDYPLLLPLLYDWTALFAGSWPDRWFGALFVLFGLGAVGVVRGILEEELGPASAAAATLALTPLAVAPYLGLAEGPLIAYATAGLLLLRRGVACATRDDLTLGALLLGLAASTKNEGLTLVLAAAVAMASTAGARRLLYLWPALVLPLPWLLVRRLHGLSTDLTASGAFTRLAERIADPGEIIRAIASTPFGKPLFWVGLALALLVAGPATLRRERLVLGAVAVQYLFYLGAYFVTPHDIQWHVTWSWERIVNQMTMLLAFVAVGSALRELVGSSRNASAG